MSYLISIGISAVVAVASLFGAYSYVPLSWYESEPINTFGATITNIAGTDTLSNSRGVINTNFTNLNNNKIEMSTTSVASITTLSNLATIGTITSGIWNSTAIGVAYGGTGTTSPSQYLVMIGDGSYGLTTASTTGTNGQFLTSGGAGAYPTWTTGSFDTAADYTNTGEWSFTSATSTIADNTSRFTSTGVVELNGTVTVPSGSASSTVLAVDGSGNPYFVEPSMQLIATTTLSAAAESMSVSFQARNHLKIYAYVNGVANDNTGIQLQFNDDTGNNYADTADNDGTITTSTSAAGIRMAGNNLGDDDFISVIDIVNLQTPGKGVVINTTLGIEDAVSTAPVSVQVHGKWANSSSEITKITVDVIDASEQIDAGSSIAVYGSRL